MLLSTPEEQPTVSDARRNAARCGWGTGTYDGLESHPGGVAIILVAILQKPDKKAETIIYLVWFPGSQRLAPSGFIQNLLHTYCARLSWLKEFSKRVCGHRN